MEFNNPPGESAAHHGNITNVIDKAVDETQVKLRIGILGTRGIPNQYGGFEQFAEYLSAGLSLKGHDVYVYNSHNHFYQAKLWNNVHIIHCFDPSHRIGTF